MTSKNRKTGNSFNWKNPINNSF